MATNIPGMKAKHSIISPECIRIHGNNGMGAFDEAAMRLRESYRECLEGWKKDGITPTFHVVLTVERPTPAEGGEADGEETKTTTEEGQEEGHEDVK